MVSAVKIAAVLIGAASAQTSTTAAPPVDCTYAGMSNFGSGLSAVCCAAAQTMVSKALLTSTVLPPNLKSMVTSCVPNLLGQKCIGDSTSLEYNATAAWAYEPDTTAYGTALGAVCLDPSACMGPVLASLATAANGGASTFNSMNPTLLAGFDADGNGVVDSCCMLNNSCPAPPTTTSTTTTTTSTTTTITTTSTTTTTAAQTSDDNSSAQNGAVVSGAVAVFAVALASLA